MPPALEPTFNLVKLFNAKKVYSEAAKAERKSMMRQLAYIRRTAMTEVLRRRKKSSEPGDPPRIHSKGPVSLKKIFFVYDPGSSTGIVGPAKLRGNRFARRAKDPVPQTLEHGGKVIYIEEKIGGSWVLIRRSRRHSGKKPQRRHRTVTIKPRPFMQKAMELEEERGNILEPWVGSFGS